MPRALNDRSSALTAQNLIALPERFGCPVWAYDGDIIAERINQLRHFDVIRFAQKACSNIHILRLMREQGVKVDSVSLGEIERALHAGYQPGQEPAEIVFTADLLDQATLLRVTELNIPVNAGSIDMLDQLGNRLRVTLFGCASIRALVMGIARKPIPAVKTANTAFGMKNSLAHSRKLSTMA